MLLRHSAERLRRDIWQAGDNPGATAHRHGLKAVPLSGCPATSYRHLQGMSAVCRAFVLFLPEPVLTTGTVLSLASVVLAPTQSAELVDP